MRSVDLKIKRILISEVQRIFPSFIFVIFGSKLARSADGSECLVQCEGKCGTNTHAHGGWHAIGKQVIGS